MINLIHGQFENINLDNYKFNLAFLDPPDNQKMKYENYNDNLKESDYLDLLQTWTQKACEITKGPVFLSIAEKYIATIEKLIDFGSIKLIQRIYWYYSFGQNNKTRYSPCVRPIYWLNEPTIYAENIKIKSDREVKYKDKRAKNGGKLPNNVWDFSRVCGTFKEKRKFHPTQHPEKLIERIILGHSKPGDLILDGFVGSGTTAIVCKRLNRSFVGIDCSQYYLNKIKEILNDR